VIVSDRKPYLFDLLLLTVVLRFELYEVLPRRADAKVGEVASLFCWPSIGCFVLHDFKVRFARK